MSSSQQIAAITTVVVAVLVTVLLTSLQLSWNPEQPWPPQPEPYIEMDQEEFIIPQEIANPAYSPETADAPALTEDDMDNPSEAAPQTGAALNTQGPAGKENPREVTTKRESTAKAAPTPKPKDPGAEKAKKEQQEKEAAAKRTQNNVRNAFANPNAKGNSNNNPTGDQKAGSKTGNNQSAGPANSTSTTAGLRHGRVSGGWLWPSYPSSISTSLTGSIILSLTIDKSGNVTDAVPSGGEAPAASNRQLQQQCIKLAKSRRFTRKAGDDDAPESARATLTFIFENKKQ